MDKKYIEENEIEIKYLRDQLTDQELEEFEVYLMENPEIIFCVELTEALNCSIEKSSENFNGGARSLWGLGSLSKTRQQSAGSIFGVPFKIIVGCFVVGYFSSFLLHGYNDDANTPATALKVLQVANTVTLSPLRSIDLGLDELPVAYVFDDEDQLSRDVYFSIRVRPSIKMNPLRGKILIIDKEHIGEIDSTESELLIDLGEISRDQNGVIFLVLDANDYPPGQYSLILEGPEDTEAYRFRTVQDERR